MSSEILINAAIGEMRLAHIENGKAVEIRLFRDYDHSLVGAIYHGRVTSLSTEFQAAFVELGKGLSGFLPLNFLPKRPGKKPQDLTTLLNEGQKIIVQVTADATGDKLAKLTCRIEVVSSALILHPFREGAFISSRIKDPSRREDLKSFTNGLNLKGMGLTLRTEAEHLSNEDVKQISGHLINHWLRAIDNRDRKKIPFLLSQGPDHLLQILRQYGSTKYDQITFDQPATLKNAQNWAREFSPDLLARMSLHKEATPLFEHFEVEEELDRLLDKHIALASGAWITIEQTEAMVAIDVNMGAAKLRNDPAKQRLAVNFEAAKEIFRQIRLRGLSGLIVIDFINMSGKSDNSNLLGVVDNLILNDPIQIQRSNLSSFGLLELARKASTLSLSRLMLGENKPMANIETTVLSLLRQWERDAAAKPGLPLKVTTTLEVKSWFTTHPEYLKAFVRRTGSTIDFKLAIKTT